MEETININFIEEFEDIYYDINVSDLEIQKKFSGQMIHINSKIKTINIVYGNKKFSSTYDEIKQNSRYPKYISLKGILFTLFNEPETLTDMIHIFLENNNGIIECDAYDETENYKYFIINLDMQITGGNIEDLIQREQVVLKIKSC